jgi:hypothetical protein
MDVPMARTPRSTVVRGAAVTSTWERLGVITQR